MSYNSMIAPTKYFQGKGLLNEIYDRTCHLGKKYAFLVDDIVYNIIEAKIKKAFEGKDGEYIYIFHGGESTLEEALRIATLLRENECDIIVGVGGGKVLDSAKRAAMELEHVKTVIVPTSAASDLVLPTPASMMSAVRSSELKSQRRIRPSCWSIQK